MKAHNRGLTLIEVLVAVALLALLSGLAWRGLEQMLRARELAQSHLDRHSRLQTVLAQWERDLAELQDSGGLLPALEFDGRSLRLTRRQDDGLQVVSWWVADGRLWRWAAAPTTQRSTLLAHFERAGQTPTLSEQALPALDGVVDWQLAYFRGNAWTNAQSSADLEPEAKAPEPPASAPPPDGAGSAPPPGERARAQLPAGVRLTLRLQGAGLNGTLVRQVQVVGGS